MSFVVSAVVSGSVAHPFPEYTEREHVFALSTAFGDAFLMQVRCTGVQSTHNSASLYYTAASFLFRRGFNDDSPKFYVAFKFTFVIDAVGVPSVPFFWTTGRASIR